MEQGGSAHVIARRQQATGSSFAGGTYLRFKRSSDAVAICFPRMESGFHDPGGLRRRGHAEPERSHSNQGIEKPKGEEQPIDRERAQTVHQTSSKKSTSHEATRDQKLSNSNKTSGRSESR
jgi:hypothetical protein